MATAQCSDYNIQHTERIRLAHMFAENVLAHSDKMHTNIASAIIY